MVADPRYQDTNPSSPTPPSERRLYSEAEADQMRSQGILQGPNGLVSPDGRPVAAPTGQQTNPEIVPSGITREQAAATAAGAPAAPHPTGGGRVASSLTFQSESPPQYIKPPIDPRPYAYFAKNDPQMKQLIDEAADLTGVNPIRLAAHKWMESRSSATAPRGADGEIGVMQILPSTAREIDPSGRLNPANLRDGLVMAGMYINKLDSQYGQDSLKSIARYNGSGPMALAYARKMTGLGSDRDFDPRRYGYDAGDGSMSTRGLVQAGVNGGPDGFLTYATANAPTGMPLSDVWRKAESKLVSAFIAAGNLEGAQHARDFVLQMSQAGSNYYLMAAHKALSIGDGQTAAQYLAKAHAFFPDDTLGQFKTDGRNVWAQRVDEHDPSRTLGSVIQITPGSIAAMLNQTTDPLKYLQTLNTEQKAAADARLKQLHGDYYAALPQNRLDVAGVNAAARVQAAQIHANAAGQGAQQRAIDKETNENFGATSLLPGVADAPPAVRGAMAETYRDIRRNGASGPQAEATIQGLSDRTLKLVQMDNGHYQVVDKQGKPQGTYISRDVAQRLAPPTQPAAAPVGAGATSGYAVGAGITNNLAGTTMPGAAAAPAPSYGIVPPDQSSAMPVQ